MSHHATAHSIRSRPVLSCPVPSHPVKSFRSTSRHANETKTKNVTKKRVKKTDSFSAHFLKKAQTRESAVAVAKLLPNGPSQSGPSFLREASRGALFEGLTTAPVVSNPLVLAILLATPTVRIAHPSRMCGNTVQGGTVCFDSATVLCLLFYLFIYFFGTKSWKPALNMRRVDRYASSSSGHAIIGTALKCSWG